jgi:hypothetical protein
VHTPLHPIPVGRRSRLDVAAGTGAGSWRLRPDRLPTVPGVDLALRHQPDDGDSRAGTAFCDVFAVGDSRWRFVAGHIGHHLTGGPPVAETLARLALDLCRAAGPTGVGSSGGGPSAGGSSGGGSSGGGPSEGRPSGRGPVAGGPAAAIGRLDRLVQRLEEPAAPIGAVCVDLVRRDGTFVLVVARMAHRPPLVMRSTGAVLAVRVPAGPPGRAGWPEPAELAVDLQPGDTVLLCTGGAGPGEPIGDPRFAALLAGCASRPPQAVLDHLGQALADRWAPPAPGASFLAVRVGGGRVRAAAPAWQLG